MSVNASISKEVTCPLCAEDGGEVVFSHPLFRVVLVDDENYPGFCRVIWQQHIKEMTDLASDQRDQFMRAVFVVEAAQREIFQPHKINLASLGNVVPHLHWHVIPRFANDAHYPDPIWGKANGNRPDLSARRAQLPQFLSKLQANLTSIFSDPTSP